MEKGKHNITTWFPHFPAYIELVLRYTWMYITMWNDIFFCIENPSFKNSVKMVTYLVKSYLEKSISEVFRNLVCSQTGHVFDLKKPTPPIARL